MQSVSVSVYHLTSEGANSVISSWSKLGGLYHVGVEVCGVEWSYGYCDKGSGVFAVAPTECSLGPLKESAYLGSTNLCVSEIIHILHDMRTVWIGEDYSILNRNCVTFSREFLTLLSPTLKLPKYVTAMVDIGVSVGSIREIKPLSKAELFGSPEKEVMWKAAEKLMHDYAKGEPVVASVLPAIRHARQPIVPAHTPVQTREICARKFYRVRFQNRQGYMNSMSSRFLLRATSS